MESGQDAAPLWRTEIFIGYADTDAAGIIYFAAWFPWMERMHTQWLDTHGVRFPELMARCGSTVASRATACEYIAIVRPYDRIDAMMSAGHVGERSYRLDFTMTRAADGVTVARASLTLAGVGAEGRSARLPDAITTLLVPARAGTTL